MTFEEASKIMLDKGFRHLPVVDGETVLGIVSLRRIMGGRRTSEQVALRRRAPGAGRHDAFGDGRRRRRHAHCAPPQLGYGLEFERMS